MENDLSTRSRDVASMTVRLRLGALADNVMLVRQAIDGAAREFGATDRKIDDIKLAVTEGCSNVVKYAYRGGPGTLEVGVDDLGDGIAVLIADAGTWLERAPSDSEVGGLGIPLMEAVSRNCEIESGPEGTSVYLEFSLDADDSESDESAADA